MQIPKDSKKFSELLNAVSTKLGVPPETLRQDIQNGKFDRALAAMKPQDAAAFQQVLNHPQLLDQIMNSKQAKALYEKLSQS